MGSPGHTLTPAKPAKFREGEHITRLLVGECRAWLSVELSDDQLSNKLSDFGIDFFTAGLLDKDASRVKRKIWLGEEAGVEMQKLRNYLICLPQNFQAWDLPMPEGAQAVLDWRNHQNARRKRKRAEKEKATALVCKGQQ